MAQAVAIAPVTQPPPLLASVPAIEGQALPRIPNEVTRLQQVRPLPGALDATPVFNSNSPELIQQEGILLSTFPKDQMAYGNAHLDYAFEGRFDFFAHHVARGVTADDRRTLFIGGVVYNPSSQPVTLEILQGVSYLSQEAPFRNLPALSFNPDGKVFAGPGSRTVTDFLQGRRQSQWPQRITIPPQRAYLLMNAPIPLRRLPFAADATLPPGSVLPGATTTSASAPVASVVPAGSNRQLPSNGRSALLHLTSSAPVYVATLAMYAPRTLDGQERAPTLQEWLLLLVNGNLAGPRDIPPTNPEDYRKTNGQGRFFYGRVAGVAQGSLWEAIAADAPNADQLTIPDAGQAISYVLSTVDYNTFGTAQIQSAPMLVRYADTAYRAHGNYGVHYKVNLPLYNDSEAEKLVLLRLQTPLQDETLGNALRFLRNPADRIFFRGTVRVRYQTTEGQDQTRYVHVVQRQGEEGEPILRLALPPNARRNVVVEFIYPPDATPPQVLTVSTAGAASARFTPDSVVEAELPASGGTPSPADATDAPLPDAEDTNAAVFEDLDALPVAPDDVAPAALEAASPRMGEVVTE
ncbi:MAG TPA: DUF3370 domain-containing protein [Candidatus Obscuribacterales bacterium]